MPWYARVCGMRGARILLATLLNSRLLLWPAGAGGTLCVLQPAALRDQFSDGCLWGSTATFAAPGPEDRLRGLARWIADDGCGGSGGEAFLTQGGANGSGLGQLLRRTIDVVRRGHCSFARKSRAARYRGARAVVVVDFADSQAEEGTLRKSLVAGDGLGEAGLVPTFLIGSVDAEPLIANLADPSAEVIVELRWDLPRVIARLDIWLPLLPTEVAEELLLEMAPHVRDIGPALHVHPHYRVHSAEGLTGKALVSQCLAALPEFCANSESDAELGTIGPAGAEVLREAQRRHCIRFVHSEASEGIPEVWWEYLKTFDRVCPGVWAPRRGRYARVKSLLLCSELAMAVLGSVLDATAVETCLAERGLLLMEEGTNMGQRRPGGDTH